MKSARRAIELVETFAAADGWLTASELHERTGMPRSSLHGLLRTLHEAGWVSADEGQGRYRLGVRALICGTAYLDRDPVAVHATRTLEDVRSRTGYTAHFARRHGDEVVYLETRESQRSTHLVSRVGRTLPAHATALGKALLAELTTEEVDRVLPAELRPLTPNTVTDRAALHEQLAQVRDEGVASEVEESSLGVRCVAAVIPYRIPATDALSCSMPMEHSSDLAAIRLEEVLRDAADELGRTLRKAGIR
ncbi:IclR family transcriptional regulator [Nocardioides mangrovicus]|uniref:Glycerol operon regulatory protein n=1 Tax=Nocardioides mangrovicus TaxID=2478913 RepID=A0A3L8P6E1_9ACTN|nr:IclR family transcriptional regulator [Nocardioides mangrovicus]